MVDGGIDSDVDGAAIDQSESFETPTGH